MSPGAWPKPPRRSCTRSTEHQRELAAWPFPADDERRRWFYTPTDHGGLPLSAMRPAQQRLRLPARRGRAVAPGLRHGVDDHRAGERARRARGLGGAVRPRARPRSGLYYLRVFGEPSTTGTWSWRFGGHHVSLNHLIVDGHLEAWTPLFLGADPASSPLLGPHPLRPLAGAEDLARELVHALDPGQRAAAVLVAGAAGRPRRGQPPPRRGRRSAVGADRRVAGAVPGRARRPDAGDPGAGRAGGRVCAPSTSTR